MCPDAYKHFVLFCFSPNFILDICLTHEVQLGYCRLIYYAFFLFKIREAILWWCRKCVEKINMTGKTALPSTYLAFPWEFAPFILSASLVSKAALNWRKLGSGAVTKEVRHQIPVLNEDRNIAGKIVNFHKTHVHTQVSDNALQSTHKCRE